MIGKISGIFIGYYNNIAIIDINLNDCSIGYEVVMKNTDILSMQKNNKYVIYIKEIVKEDDDLLYGFLSFEDRCWFEEFIKLNSLGPKIALSILSTYDINSIQEAIINNNCDFFSSINGIGGKLANRIPNEMKKNIDKINAKILTFNDNNLSNNNYKEGLCFNDDTSYNLDNNQQKDKTKIEKKTKNNDDKSILNDAVNALITLGFSKQQVYSDIFSIVKENQKLSTEEIVKLFLKQKYN